MAATFISVNTAQRLGQQLRQTVDQLRSAKDALAKLKAVMDTQIDGNDYSKLESQFGLQAGDGVSTYNLTAGVVADLAASNETSLLNRLG